MERTEGGFECQLSDHTVCDSCICSFKGGILLPSATVTALSPCLLSPCLSTLFSPQVNFQTDTISNPSVINWSSGSWSNGEEASSVTPGSFVFSFKGDPLQDSDRKEAYCGI